MGFRFSRRLKILPGLTVNLSRSGVSASVGVKGAHVTVGRGHVRETVGLPGTGISYTETQRLGGGEAPEAAQPEPTQRHVSWFKVLVLTGLVLFLAYLIAHRDGPLSMIQHRKPTDHAYHD